MTLSERYIALLKSIHLNTDVPKQFSARHLVTRCKGLALKDPKNLEMKIAIVNCVGVSLSIKALGILLSEKIHGRRFGDYQLEGHRCKDGSNYSAWQYTLLYFGAPVVEPTKPEIKLSREDKRLFKDPAHRETVLGLQKLIAKDEAADKLAADQQRRLEHAENRETLEHLRKVNAEQRRRLRTPDEPPPVTSLNYDRANKPLKWKLGERFSSVMGDGVYTGTPQDKAALLDNGRIISIVEVAQGPPKGSPQAILESYVKIATDALMRGDDRSVTEIAASMRVWSPRGVGNFILAGIPIDRGSNFYADNESESDALDRRFKGYK